MDKVLRDIVLGLGILLGIIPTEAPVLSARVFRDDRAIYLNLDVARAFPKEADGLLESGNELVLAFTVVPEGFGSRSFTHGIRYDPISRRYTVRIEETGTEHLTESKAAAMDIVSRVFGFELLMIGGFDPAKGLDVLATCSLEAPGMDATVVWNYRTPVVRLFFSSLNGIPR
jgi:hypothetical protein